ncbi:hypothetical protein CHCC20441_3470 [Bacillus licheniformis]|uniref:Uncharacterized protein n=1 Tax=Bacillus licheniformis TaxID=1402 RepID=A0A8B5YAK6_BACLI|nr:hypothetical protein B4090_1779 [Bacillus licheniformis]TWJ55378.1 hypothetical protein CHCC5023_2576 [Bacillus paralicheniformis]TWN17073.1 hypothetical protein CHCC14564_1638 [Bacillus licheniformis LMG 17339]KYC83149.1 hypothetical protein B4091_1727 [Bacillus licheniformis]KYD00979.1 hypothetical protein B4164_1662 [Bacillus licheniformis]
MRLRLFGVNSGHSFINWRFLSHSIIKKACRQFVSIETSSTS